MVWAALRRTTYSQAAQAAQAEGPLEKIDEVYKIEYKMSVDC